MNRARIRRRKSFEVRIGVGEEVFGLDGTEYITVHPFADDTALLQRFSLSPVSCCKVDAYWRVRGDVLFVQVLSSTLDQHRGAGQYARWDSTHQQAVLWAVVDEPTITKAIFEAELIKFLNRGVVGRAMSKRHCLGEALRRV